jgi:hypothetical protein
MLAEYGVYFNRFTKGQRRRQKWRTRTSIIERLQSKMEAAGIDAVVQAAGKTSSPDGYWPQPGFFSVAGFCPARQTGPV